MEPDTPTLDTGDLSEAVAELYEDLRTRVGKEIHLLIGGHYNKPVKPKVIKKKPVKKKAPTTEEEWENQYRPTTALVTPKKKKKPVTIVRRPFGPHQAYKSDKEGEVAYLLILLSSWGDKTAVGYSNPTTGKTALHIAAALGRSDFIQTLIDYKAPVNTLDLSGNSPVLEAAKGGHLAATTALVLAGADIHICNKYGNTPLSAAARNLCRDVCELLLMLGADISVVNVNNETPVDRVKDEEFRAFLVLCSDTHAGRVVKSDGGEDGENNTPVIKVREVLAEFRMLHTRKEGQKENRNSTVRKSNVIPHLRRTTPTSPTKPREKA